MSTVVTTAFSLILVHYLGTVTLPSPGQSLTNGEASHLAHRLLVVFVPVLAVDAVLGFIVHTVLTGLLTMVIGRGVLGQQISAGDAWRLVRQRLPALLGTTMLVLLVICSAGWLIFALIAVLLALRGGGGGGGVAALAAIGTVVLTIYLGTMLRTAGVVTVLEREGPGRSLARSWRLVRGSFWRVFGISLLAGVIMMVTDRVLQIPFNLIAGTAGSGRLGLPAPGGTRRG